MTIAYLQTASATTGNGGSFANTTVAAAITPTTVGNVLVVTLGIRGDTTPVTGVTVAGSDGTTFTQVTVGGYIQMYIGAAATAGSPVTVTATSPSAMNASIAVSEYSGASTTTGASNSRSTGTVKGATLSLTTTAAGSWVAWGMNNSTTGTGLLPSGAVSRADISTGGLSDGQVKANGCDTATSVASGTAVTFGWTSTTFTDASLAGFELKAASGSSTVTGSGSGAAVSTATGASTVTVRATGAATATSAATGSSTLLIAGTGAGTSASTAAGTGSSFYPGTTVTGTGSGTASSTATGASRVIVGGDGAALGTSLAAGAALLLIPGTGTALATSTATGTGGKFTVSNVPPQRTTVIAAPASRVTRISL